MVEFTEAEYRNGKYFIVDVAYLNRSTVFLEQRYYKTRAVDKILQKDL